jgi:hypothetical protein
LWRMFFNVANGRQEDELQSELSGRMGWDRDPFPLPGMLLWRW